MLLEFRYLDSTSPNLNSSVLHIRVNELYYSILFNLISIYIVLISTFNLLYLSLIENHTNKMSTTSLIDLILNPNINNNSSFYFYFHWLIFHTKNKLKAIPSVQVKHILFVDSNFRKTLASKSKALAHYIYFTASEKVLLENFRLLSFALFLVKFKCNFYLVSKVTLLYHLPLNIILFLPCQILWRDFLL